MEVITLFFVFAVSLGFLIWAMKFKSFLSMLAIPPMLIIVIIVLFLNTDPSLEYIVPNNQCGVAVTNSTATVNGNITTTSYNNTLLCQTFNNEVPYPIQPQLMTLLNFSIIVGMLSVMFVVFRRVTRKTQPDASDDD